MVKVEPVLKEHLPAVARFLHINMNSKISEADWLQAFSHQWTDGPAPNYGFMLRDDGEVVGVRGAIYSDQNIDGVTSRLCNLSSWCVLEPYRKRSAKLLLSVLAQKGMHIYATTPNPKVAKIYHARKLEYLDMQTLVLLNLPLPLAGLISRGWVEREPSRIAEVLPGDQRKIFQQHRSIPWLGHFAYGQGDRSGYMAFRRSRYKRMNSIKVLHISDSELLLSNWTTVGNYLFFGEGAKTTQIALRWVTSDLPSWIKIVSHTFEDLQPKMYRPAKNERTLRPDQLTDLYTELASLEI